MLLFAVVVLGAVALWIARIETRRAIDDMACCDFFAWAWTRTTLEWWRWWQRRRVWIVIALALSVCFATACIPGQADARARSALDALAKVVDPAWALAEDSCLASQRVVAARETSGLTQPVATTAALTTIRARCDVVTDAFERIRAAHMDARRLLDEGKVSDAERLLEQILAQWRALQGARDGA